jgi:hypothetical protein
MSVLLFFLGFICINKYSVICLTWCDSLETDKINNVMCACVRACMHTCVIKDSCLFALAEMRFK